MAEERTGADALAQRLRAAAEILCPQLANADDLDPGSLLDELVRAVQHSRNENELWLLLTALTGAFPTIDLMLASRRHLELGSHIESGLWLLKQTATHAALHGEPAARMILVSGRAVVAADVSARPTAATDGHQVVRNVAPRLVRDRDAVPVRWAAGAFRMLSPAERAQLLDAGDVPPSPRDAPETTTLVIPWKTSVIIPGVDAPDRCDLLAGLARFSGSSVVLVGYHCIPASSGDLASSQERDDFGHYLDLVKYSHAVAGVSRTARDEFAGFVSALRTQGVSGPDVVAVPLANGIDQAADATPLQLEGTIVLSMGGLDMRSNQLTVLIASELLWRRGHAFTLLVATPTGHRPADARQVIEHLEKSGRPVRIAPHASEAYLRRALASARFCVLPVLHGGSGFETVASLSAGVPVVTSGFGLTRELAEGQGGVLVDPQSVDEIVEAMQALLTDDELLTRLRDEAAGRTPRTWDDYTNDLWDVVLKVAPPSRAATRGGR